MSHTPLPWTLEPGEADPEQLCIGSSSGTIAILEHNPWQGIDQQANGELVFRSVTAHADLLAALTDIVAALDLHAHWQPTMAAHLAQQARAAIAKAEGCT